MPEDPSKKPLLSKEITSDKKVLERMHQGTRNVTFTREGAEELIRRVRSIGVQMVDPPMDNGKWKEVFGRVGEHRQREVTDYSLKGKKGKPVPEGLLKVLQRRAGRLMNFAKNRALGPLGIITDPFFHSRVQENYEFEKRLGTVTAYAMEYPDKAFNNAGELADFLFRDSDQETYENELTGAITDYRELNQIGVAPEYIEAMHQEELWEYLESPSLLSEHPSLQGPSTIVDFKTGLPRLLFHGQKGNDPIYAFEQQRKNWSEAPQQEFGAMFVGSAGQALDIVNRMRTDVEKPKETFVLPDVAGVEMDVKLAELQRKLGQKFTTGSKANWQGRSSLGNLPFAGVVDTEEGPEQTPAKWYAGVVDLKNPMTVSGDIGWWTVWNILGYMSGDPSYLGEDTNEPLSTNIFQAKNRQNYLGKFTYWPESDYFEENYQNAGWKIPPDNLKDIGSGTAFQRVLEYAEVHAQKEGKTIKFSDDELMEMDLGGADYEEMFGIYDFDPSMEMTSNVVSQRKLDAQADKILAEGDPYQQDFDYFVNLGFKDFLLKDLGIDGIQFFNSIEDKLVSDWSYILLDGTQFKNIKQRKKAGEGFDKSKRPHMSKYQKTAKYRKVS